MIQLLGITYTTETVCNSTLADICEWKNDLVEGKYVVEAKKGATVAVKVTDMLGEEVLVVRLLSFKELISVDVS